jgi:aspartyl-tRNA(Asn)/glutamyl-tRNA(Gln) amidotransferase subunit A
MDLTFASMSDLTKQVLERKISALEITRHFLGRISELDPKLNAFITVDAEKAEEQARRVDQQVASGETHFRLAGLPFGIKDMLCTRGLRTTAGSKILENFVPPYDATIVERLKAQGAIILGKMNQDEFAMGSSNETSFFGPVKNPWDITCVPGGSSGGSAAAQASRLVVASIGTDTGGSIRQPASFCGVVGVKPTYGRVSRYGVIAYASSLDQAGPITSSVGDAALTLEIISGFDSRDATSSSRKVPAFAEKLSEEVEGVRIGVLEDSFQAGLHPDVEKAVNKAVANLKDRGAEIRRISLPLLRQSIPAYYLIATSEASSNLARYDGVRYGFRAPIKENSVSLEEFYSITRGQGFGAEVKRRILIGTFCLSSGFSEAYYIKACQVRRLIQRQYEEAFSHCDVILSPVSATPAFKIGERVADPLAMYLNDLFTTSTNLAGLPGMSVPFALSGERLPIGLQLTAPAFQEQIMLNVGRALETASEIRREQPRVI